VNRQGAQGLNKVVGLLYQTYPKAQCGLIYHNAWELLLATILSAQTKDENVNKVTPILFSQYPTVNDIQKADQKDIRKIIHSCGFHRNKAKNIQKAADYIICNKNGEVPDSIEELIKIPGVGRKTANVVLAEWFKKAEGIVVDTHVKRVAYRLGWTESTDPKVIERDLISLCSICGQIDKLTISHVLIEHGRKICDAKKPKCESCPVKDYCKYYKLSRHKDKV
jgi:endonuclease-3